MLSSSLRAPRKTLLRSSISPSFVSKRLYLDWYHDDATRARASNEETVRNVNYRVCNFSASPGAIDLSVLQTAQRELTNFDGTGMGIFEMSHRSDGADVQKLIANLSHRISKLLRVPQHFHIFFMHGGAHSQFAAVPLNLCGLHNQTAVGGYVNTGYWSQRARAEASKFVKTVDVCQSDGKSIPEVSSWDIPSNCDYVHLCANETISGIEFLTDPELPPELDTVGGPPLVADFTSTLFSRPIEWDKYGMIYASAGQNFGPAGMCICFVREDVLAKAEGNQAVIPSTLSWSEYAKSEPVHSIPNTPAAMQLWMTDLILQRVYRDRFDPDIDRVHHWVKRRSNTIYNMIEQFPTVYCNEVAVECRSTMNVPVRCFDHMEKRIDSVTEHQFLKEAEEQWSLFNLDGDHSVGGIRISLYTGIPDEAVKAVAKFMHHFADHRTGMEWENPLEVRQYLRPMDWQQ